MAIVNGYANLANLKARLGITDAAEDSVLENIIEAISRSIDNYCGRRFYRNSADETRYYTAESPNILFVDDLGTITTLKTDSDGDRTYEDTWAVTDYDLDPFNASLDGRPYTAIRITPNGTKSFPATRKGVEIVGKFGYAATTPDAIDEACLIQSARIYKRKEAPFGVAGASEMGTVVMIATFDPDVKLLLDPFRRVYVGAI